ncbi:MAG: tetratricopeptide repeat protein [Methanococci archaeon]|nr:tetratricopeptide repeat protein [Methanococci archaeon]
MELENKDDSKKEFERDLRETDVLASLTYLLKSYECRDRGDLLESLYCIDMALEINPKFKFAKFLKAISLAILGEVGKAIEYLKEITSNSNDPIAYALLGQLYEIMGNLDEALKCYEKSLNIEEKFATAFFFKALCLCFSGRYEELIKCCDRLISLSPNFIPAYLFKAHMLGKLGKYEEALVCLDKVLEINENDRNAIYLKALLLKRVGKLNEALKYYEKLIDELNVRWLGVIRDAIYLCFLFNKLEKAKKYIEMGLELRPNDPSLWYFKGRLYEKQGDLEKALKYYDKAIELMPHHTKALLGKARVLEKLGRIEESVEYYNMALDK